MKIISKSTLGTSYLYIWLGVSSVQYMYIQLDVFRLVCIQLDIKRFLVLFISNDWIFNWITNESFKALQIVQSEPTKT